MTDGDPAVQRSQRAKEPTLQLLSDRINFVCWQGRSAFLCRECTLMVLDRNKKALLTQPARKRTRSLKAVFAQLVMQGSPRNAQLPGGLAFVVAGLAQGFLDGAAFDGVEGQTGERGILLGGAFV